ncbi:hypothetical protein HDU76_010029, partial [Blyttiomyces sp. JEL0837]
MGITNPRVCNAPFPPLDLCGSMMLLVRMLPPSLQVLAVHRVFLGINKMKDVAGEVKKSKSSDDWIKVAEDEIGVSVEVFGNEDVEMVFDRIEYSMFPEPV